MGDTFGLIGSIIEKNGDSLVHRVVVEAQSHHQPDPCAHIRTVTTRTGEPGQQDAWAALRLPALDSLIDYLRAARQRMTGSCVPVGSDVPVTEAQPRIVWGWAEYADAEEWYGSFATREEAIREALGCSSADSVWIMSGEAPTTSQLFDVYQFIERAGEAAYDEYAGAEGWPDVPGSAIDELKAYVDRWVARHCKPNFWMKSGDAERIDRPKEP